MTLVALAKSLLVATSYVLSLYLVPRSVRGLPRNHPRHIQYRILASSTATVFAVLCVHATPPAAPTPLLQRLGLPPGGFSEQLRGVAMGVGYMVLLFLGPLATRTLAWLRGWRSQETMTKEEQWMALRNLGWAPLSEEVVFRGVLAALLRGPDGWGPWEVALRGPLVFGVAHLHHFFARRAQGVARTRAMQECLLQFAYTWLFGFLAFLLLFGMGLGAAWGGHVFCNVMGLPDLSFLAPQGGYYSYLYDARHKLLAAYAMGIGAFVLAMRELGKSF